MKTITVFGANGKVGQLVVEGLLARNYRVVAFVYNAHGQASTKNLLITEGDIHDGDAVNRALDGADAVISVLGSWGTPTKDILSAGMSYIIPAMEKQGIRRIVSLTGAEARAKGDDLSVIHRFAHIAAKLAAGKILADGEDHLKQLEQSKLDWTVLRSPIMNEKGAVRYTLSHPRPMPWHTINRQAVADAIVEQLNDAQYHGKSPFITR